MEYYLNHIIFIYEGFPEVIIKENKAYLKFLNEYYIDNKGIIWQVLDVNDKSQDCDKVKTYFDTIEEYNNNVINDYILYLICESDSDLFDLEYNFKFIPLGSNYKENEIWSAFMKLSEINHYNIDLVKLVLLDSHLLATDYLIKVILNRSVSEFKRLCIDMIKECNDVWFQRWLYCLDGIFEGGLYALLLSDIKKMYFENEMIKNNPQRIKYINNNLSRMSNND